MSQCYCLSKWIALDYVGQEDEKTDSHPMYVAHRRTASDSKAGRKYVFWVYCFKNSGILQDYHNTKGYNNMSESDHNKCDCEKQDKSLWQ